MKSLFLALLLTNFIIVGLLCAAAETDPSLILYLPFDEGDEEEAEDFSQYGNNGELKGGPEWVDGKFEKALMFDGVDAHVLVPHAEILCVDEEVTVMAWINTPRYTGPGGVNWQGIVAKSNNPRSYSLYTRINEVLTFSTVGFGSFSATKLPLNEWVHVAALVEDGAHVYYFNGEFAGQSGADIKLPGLTDTADVLVGKTHEGSREFLGMIDEIRIWNRALSQDEVKREMNRGKDSASVSSKSRLTIAWGQIKI